MSNAIVHIDISGPDPVAQHRFYGQLFEWEVDEKGPGYALVRTPHGGPDGALVEADSASVAFGVAVADLAGAVDKATALGGTVVMPPTDNGWVVKAQVTDPAGNLITLIQA
jgi:predicted enzyme related to lactoylglutathione lyase